MIDSRRFEREQMVNAQLQARGIVDKNVINAMLKIERHRFVPAEFQSLAYADRPIPLTEGQTISQPYIVGFMCQALNLSGKEKVLEIGTGSGYQTAILTCLAHEVFSIEIREELAQLARKNLASYASDRLHLRVSDGWLGWPEEAPFDAIILSASPPEIPQILLKQLGISGRFIAPVGGKDEQVLVFIESTPQGMKRTNLMSVTFVPMRTGGAL